MSMPTVMGRGSMASCTDSGRAMTTLATSPSRFSRGFTLVELLVVMAILALLMSIAAPRYFASVDGAKEVALRTSLRIVRDAIDKHHADTGRYPDGLAQLVHAGYLRSAPIDPVTDSSLTWKAVAHPDGKTSGLYDLQSGAEGVGRDGTAFSTW